MTVATSIRHILQSQEFNVQFDFFTPAPKQHCIISKVIMSLLERFNAKDP